MMWPLFKNKFGTRSRASHERAEGKPQGTRVRVSLSPLPRIEQRSELPRYRTVMSTAYGVSGNDLAMIAVLDLGQREAVILLSDSVAEQTQHINVRQRLSAAGYKITIEQFAAVALIMELNGALSKNSTKESNTAQADVQALIHEIVQDAVTQSATDIHILCRERKGQVLFRIHGCMKQYKQFDVATSTQIAGFMFTNMAESRSRTPKPFSLEARSLACVFRIKVGLHYYRLRYQFIRMSTGWDVVVRLLRVEAQDERSKGFLALGYAPSQIKQINYAVARAVGLIVIAGPTGSGKSTTLKTMMESDPVQASKKRYSVEDPVEYQLDGVSQVSIQRDNHEGERTGLDSFSGALRDLLRADPDDIMVGEIRDEKTAQMTADFVLTGHKIYTTLHTNSAIGSALRLNRLGVDRHILADRQFISALVFQRLLPCMCPQCKIPVQQVLPADELHLLTHKLGLNIETIFCSSAEGCAQCNHMGVVGQTVAAEIIVPDATLRQCLLEGRDELAEQHWRKTRTASLTDSDMTGKTAFEHALYKVHLGEVDPRDVARIFEPFASYEIQERAA